MACHKNPTRHRANKDGLTPREQSFANAYIVTILNGDGKGNATEAAIAAGCPPASASQRGSGLLRRPQVKTFIDTFLESRMSQFRVTQDTLIQEAAKLAFSNTLDFMTIDEGGNPRPDFSKMTREQAAAIAEITVDEYTEGKGENALPVKRIRFKLHNKLGAIELLARANKMLTDKHEHAGPGGQPLPPPVFHIEFVDAVDGKEVVKP